jgi:restriction endonuclease
MTRKAPKRGRPFEEVVAEVVRAIDPDAAVTQGQWVDGPDGRRDRDVFVEGVVSGRPFRSLIECKDYDRSSTGPVGIGIVDALDSKRRDLNMDIAVICCNAGFTEFAVKKAKRVGIVLVGVFRQSDGRLKHDLIDQVYFRRLKIEHLGFRLEGHASDSKHECNDALASFMGQPIANWLCQHVLRVISTNPIGGGHYQGHFEFKQPIDVRTSAGQPFTATEMFTEFVLSGGWFEQPAAIDGTAGLYDFIRRRAHVGTGPTQLHLKGMDLTKGSPIDYPPDSELDISAGGTPGEVWLQLLYLIDANCKEPAPPLDAFILESDLELEISGLRPELQLPPRGVTSLQPKRRMFVSRNPKVGPNHSFTLTLPGRAPA